jgi:hypothetical protein
VGQAHHDPLRRGARAEPQDFYNVAGYEHVELSGRRRFSEQELFCRALAAGRNRWNAAFRCGTNAVARLAALRPTDPRSGWWALWRWAPPPDPLAVGAAA